MRVPLSRHEIGAARRKQARALREQGLSNTEIAKGLGVTPRQVRNYLNPGVGEAMRARSRARYQRNRERELAKSKAYRQTERGREANHRSEARRAPKKREWERQHRARCPECGGEMGAGSAEPSKRPDLCQECRRAAQAEEQRKLARTVERLWAEGLSVREMAQKLSRSPGAVGFLMHKFRAQGYDLPYRRRPG